jgi:hypothetical protein
MSYCAIHVTKNMTVGGHICMSSQQTMRLTPIKTLLQAVKKLAVTFHVACHISKNMTCANHITRQQKTWLHKVTCYVGWVYFLPGQVQEGHRLQGQSRHAPRAVGIVGFFFLCAFCSSVDYRTTSQDHQEADGLAKWVVQTTKHGLKKYELFQGSHQDWDFVLP